MELKLNMSLFFKIFAPPPTANFLACSSHAFIPKGVQNMPPHNLPSGIVMILSCRPRQEVVSDLRPST